MADFVPIGPVFGEFSQQTWNNHTLPHRDAVRITGGSPFTLSRGSCYYYDLVATKVFVGIRHPSSLYPLLLSRLSLTSSAWVFLLKDIISAKCLT